MKLSAPVVLMSITASGAAATDATRRLLIVIG
jgi:hypothetical protein